MKKIQITQMQHDASQETIFIFFFASLHFTRNLQHDSQLGSFSLLNISVELRNIMREHDILVKWMLLRLQEFRKVFLTRVL